MTIPTKPVSSKAKKPDYLTLDDVMVAHAEHGQLDWHMVKKAMGPNWPKRFEKLGPGEGIFHADEQRDGR